MRRENGHFHILEWPSRKKLFSVTAWGRYAKTSPDLSSLLIQTFDLPGILPGQPDDTSVDIYDKRRTSHIALFSLDTGKLKWHVPSGDTWGTYAFSRDGKTIALSYIKRPLKIIDAETGATLKEFPGITEELGEVASLHFDAMGKRLHAVFYSGKGYILNLESEEKELLPQVEVSGKANDSENFLIKTTDGFFLKNFWTGATIPLNGEENQRFYIERGWLLTHQRKGEINPTPIQILDPNTGKVVHSFGAFKDYPFTFSTESNFDHFKFRYASNYFQLLAGTYQVSELFAGSYIRELFLTPTPGTFIQWANQRWEIANYQTYCSPPSEQKKVWNKTDLLELIQGIKGSTTSNRTSILFKAHEALEQVSASTDFAEEKLLLLKEVSRVAPIALSAFLHAHPTLLAAESWDFGKIVSQAKANELWTVLSSLSSRLFPQWDVWGIGVRMESLRMLTAWRPVAKALPEQTIAPLIDELAHTLVQSCLTVACNEGLFESSTFYYIQEAIRRLLGLSPRPRTEVGLFPENDKFNLAIVGTDPIESKELTATLPEYLQKQQTKRGLNSFGFYLAFSGAQSKSKLSEHDKSRNRNALPLPVEWTHGNESWRAQISISGNSERILFDKAPSPPYRDFDKDKARTWVVVLGNDLGGSREMIRLAYLEYFRSVGVRFDPRAKRIPDSLPFVQQMIESSEADYLVKEMHSRGNETDAFFFPKDAVIWTGESAGPVLTRVYIVFSEKGTTMLGEESRLQNADFARWIQHREKQGGTPLLYLNLSCWSYRKAAREIYQSRSPLLIEIPTLGNTIPLWNSPHSQLRKLLSGFQQSKTYAQIRSLLAWRDVDLTGKYEAGEIPRDRFLFPDEDLYEASISPFAEYTTDITYSRAPQR